MSSGISNAFGPEVDFGMEYVLCIMYAVPLRLVVHKVCFRITFFVVIGLSLIGVGAQTCFRQI